jgi:hypothetical protein
MLLLGPHKGISVGVLEVAVIVGLSGSWRRRDVESRGGVMALLRQREAQRIWWHVDDINSWWSLQCRRS